MHSISIKSKNASISEVTPTILEMGVFDTIGYVEYQSSIELIKILRTSKPHVILKQEVKVNNNAPVYLLETQFKTDFSS